jgi:threonine/homoserine/homoserine lactone efflux protein
VNNLGNPKMAVFFASVLPQFTAPGQGMVSALVLLGVVFSALTFAWLTVYATVIPTAGRRCTRLAPSARSRPCPGRS